MDSREAMKITQYNWKAIRKLSVPDILKYITASTTPRDSYVLQVQNLIENKLHATEDEIYIYLDLASMRNFYELKYEGYSKLKTCLVDKYNIEKLKMNTLLEVIDNEIIFEYEEE